MDIMPNTGLGWLLGIGAVLVVVFLLDRTGLQHVVKLGIGFGVFFVAKWIGDEICG